MRTNEQKLIRSCYIFDIFRVRNIPTAQKKILHERHLPFMRTPPVTAWSSKSVGTCCMVPDKHCIDVDWPVVFLNGEQWLMTMLLIMCHLTSFQLISTYLIFATKLSEHDMHVCVGVSSLMPRSQARCPWDEWEPEKCKKMSRKHHSSAAKICYKL